MNNELVLVTSASVMNNELGVVRVTGDDKFVRGRSARSRGHDLRMSPSLSAIWDEAVQLNKVQGDLKSVLTFMEGKEIQNEQLVRYDREARHEASQTEDLLSELVYYRFKEEQEHQVNGEGYRFDESPGQRHAPRDLQPQVHLFEEDGDSGIGIVDMEKVGEETADNSSFIREHSSSAALQIVPYVSKPLVPARNTGGEFYIGLSREINEHIEACCSMTRNLCEALELENLDDRINIMKKDKNITTDPRETSACPTKQKVYGRDQERNLIIRKLIGEDSDGRNLAVLAIIGDGGVGKTTLANVVFNDSAVSKHFNVLLWVYVSVYFDQAKIIHKLLESLTGDGHENIKGLKELQSTLGSALKSKRVLLVLDDMWEDSQKEKWDDLLTPLLSNDALGNKILVTTRKPSVAKLIGATDHINLDGLKQDDFWHLFKECAFGDENYRGERKLLKVGKEIVVQLKGNPLAAKSVGRLLIKKINVGFWEKVRDASEWKQQVDDYDIMPALMISYKYLPVHLQQCFSYCAVFPKYYKYEKECLVNIWVAQGLIYSADKHKRLEDIGCEFFNDLVEWGFLQKEFEFMSHHVMHDLIHDLAQKVSSHESFTIGDITPQRAPQLVRHVSVLAEWVYRTEIDGTVHPNEAFLQTFSNSFHELQERNLSTLMLFGPHDVDFANTFRQEFNVGRSVRVLKLDMVLSDLDSMIQNISSFINLRYLELGFFYKGARLELPEAICKLHFLQVLDIKKNWGTSTVVPRGMNKLVNLRHFIAADELHAKIAGVGNMVFLQELKAFAVRKTSEFSVKQLGGLNQLRGSISICYLDDVGSKADAMEARISDKVHLNALHLSWSGVSKTEKRVHSINKLPILEDLKPHDGLINLRITEYRQNIPSWLSSNVHLTSLRSLHLDTCLSWETIPTPNMLPLLRELRLINMIRVSEIEIGCLEILELRNLRRLRQCIVLDKEQLSVNLQVLEVDDCIALKKFPLLFIHEDVQNEYQFTHLRRLQVRGCFGDISISQLLHIQSLVDIDLFLRPVLDEFRLETSDPENVMRMEIKRSGFVLSKEESLFQSSKLRDLVELKITDDPSLKYLAWSGLQLLASLKTFKMSNCRKIFSCMSGLSLPPSVQELEFNNCNITEKQLSQVLLSLPLLKKFSLTSCEEVTSLPIGLFTDEQNQLAGSSWHIPPNFFKTLEMLQISLRTRGHRKDSSILHFWSERGLGKFSSLKRVVIEDCPTLLSTVISGVSQIPPSSLRILRVEDIAHSRLHLSELSSLTELRIIYCQSLTCVNLDSCIALQDLHISKCNKLSSIEGLQSCKALRQLSIYGCEALCSLVVSLSTLTTLSIESNPNLAYIDLSSSTALHKLCIEGCATMASWEGLNSLSGLEHLKFENTPGFTRSWQLAAAQVESEHINIPRRLQVLNIDDIGVLCVPICSQLTSLKTLTIHGSLYLRRDYADNLTHENERALLLLTSLRALEFDKFKHLQSLPAGLRCLTSLQRLSVSKCELITSLPMGGFPASLKDMEIHACSKELTALCREVCKVQKIYFTDGTGDTD